MTTEEAKQNCQKLKDYLCAGNPMWDTDTVAETMDAAIRALSAQPEIIRCKDCLYAKTFDDGGVWCDRLTGTFRVEKEGFCKWVKV